jgi:hypothetical protein
MANRPSVPEIITVNSEQLQTQIRDLLPSQSGFGSELQASNVITPIIDLTATAEGSGLPVSLQQALAFGSQTAFSVANTTTTIANSPGFYRIVANVVFGAALDTASINMTDGLSSKAVIALTNQTAGGYSQSFDFIFWLAAGESVSITTSAAEVVFEGSVRQVADPQGSLVQPSGYPL